MNPLRQLLKRMGALAMSVVLAQWFLLPACPCVWQEVFGSVVEAPERSDAGADAIAIRLGSGHGELCCCDGHDLRTAHGVSPEVPAPKARASARIPTFDAVPPFQAAEDLLRTSGSDPPGPQASRLHLRWQVFLI